MKSLPRISGLRTCRWNGEYDQNMTLMLFMFGYLFTDRPLTTIVHLGTYFEVGIFRPAVSKTFIGGIVRFYIEYTV